MSTRAASNPAYDAEGLARLAVETGDYRLKRAAEALRELHRHDAREPDDWSDLIRLMATRFASDCRSTRAKAIRIDTLARAYKRDAWCEHRARLRLPPDTKGTAAEIVWKVLKTRGSWPAFETVRKILDGRYRPELA